MTGSVGDPAVDVAFSERIEEDGRRTVLCAPGAGRRGQASLDRGGLTRRPVG